MVVMLMRNQIVHVKPVNNKNLNNPNNNNIMSINTNMFTTIDHIDIRKPINATDIMKKNKNPRKITTVTNQFIHKNTYTKDTQKMGQKFILKPRKRQRN